MGFFSKKDVLTPFPIFSLDVKSWVNMAEKSDISVNENGETEFIDYKLVLPEAVYNLFDIVEFRIFSDEKKIETDTHSNLLFKSQDESLDQLDLIKTFVNFIDKTLKGKDQYSNTDTIRIQSGTWRGRNYMVSKKGRHTSKVKEAVSMVSIELNLENKFEFSITSINKLDLIG